MTQYRHIKNGKVGIVVNLSSLSLGLGGISKTSKFQDILVFRLDQR